MRGGDGERRRLPADGVPGGFGEPHRLPADGVSDGPSRLPTDAVPGVSDRPSRLPVDGVSDGPSQAPADAVPGLSDRPSRPPADATPGIPANPSRILLLRALGLGDFLTGIPAYRAVRRAFPDADITLAAPAPLQPLAALTGALDRLLPTGELAPVPWPFPPPDLAIDLHGRGPESRRLLTALAPDRLIAFDCAPHCPWRPDEHEVHRWCRLLTAHGIPADPADLDLARPAPPQPVADAGLVVIHPGAAFQARRWPPDRFAAVAAHLRQAGERVVVTGSAGERPLALDVARQAGLPPSSVVAGQTTLEEFALLIADAALVISGDTGTAHLATAYRRPSVVLFGPVPPEEWGPPVTRPQHIALWAAKPGYRGDPHGSTVDPALARLGVPDVLRAVERARAAAGARPS